LKENFSPVGSRTRWIPCQPCSDAWEVVKPTTVTIYRQQTRREDNLVSLYRQEYDPERLGHQQPSFGPHRQPCLKVLETFWTIEVATGGQFWDGEIVELDSRCIRRLARAYGDVGRNEGYGGQKSLVDRCVDFERSELELVSSMMMNARFWVYPVYLSPEVARKINAARNLIIFWVVAGLTLAGGCYGGLHLTA
jgi:hypothetical protein